MTEPTKPDLVGFLLGALDPTDHAQTERAIDQSPQLGKQTGLLRRSLKRVALDCRPDHEDPPANLTERTCQWIWDQVQTHSPASAASLSEVIPADLAPPPRNSAADIAVAACILLIAFAVFLPALEASRFHAGVLACQKKLQEVGTALHTYSDMQPDRSFPKVETAGNRAAAGVYAPVLVSHQLVQNDRSFFCSLTNMPLNLEAAVVPTLEALDQATGQTLAQMQSRMGGSFAYSLGHWDGDKYVPPVDQHREHFALLGDAPARQLNQAGNHRNRGQNIYFEDGHVKFIKQMPMVGPLDDPFTNRHGFIAAGTDRNDAVLGNSADAPFTQDFNPTKLRVTLP